MASSWNRAFKGEDSTFADFDYHQVLDGDGVITHASCHTLALQDVLNTTGSDGTWHTLLVFVTVAGWVTMESMASNDTLETLSFGGSTDVHLLTGDEYRGVNRISTLEGCDVRSTEFYQVA